MNPARLLASTFLFASLLASARPGPAEPVADVTLPSVQGGKAFRLSENRGRFVALHFLLKTECPFCIKHTHTYLKRIAEVPDVVHAFIKPDTEEEIRGWAKDMPKESPIYRDADAAFAKRMGIPHGYRFHGQTVHYPALVLLDPEGREVFRHVGQDNVDRYKFDDFAKKIAELKAKTGK
jgi:peroxiredoxin Q/BCP